MLFYLLKKHNVHEITHCICFSKVNVDFLENRAGKSRSDVISDLRAGDKQNLHVVQLRLKPTVCFVLLLVVITRD